MSADPGLRLKASADVVAANFDPGMARILVVVLQEAPLLVDDEVVVTSGVDRPLGRVSGLHPKGRAFDFRVWNIEAPNDETRLQLALQWQLRVQARLGADYDVLLHGEGSGLHVHVEWDPKRGRRVTGGFYARMAQASERSL